MKTENAIWLMTKDQRLSVILFALAVWQLFLPRWMMSVVFLTLCLLAFMGLLREVY